MIAALILALALAPGSTPRVHDRPFYVAETTVCVHGGQGWRCNVIRAAEYPSFGMCQEIEWRAVLAYARGLPVTTRVAARVRCTQTYDA